MKKVTLILAASLLVGAFIGVSLQAVRADVFPPSALIATSSPDTSTTGYTLPFGRSSSTPLYIPYSQSTTSALAVVELVSCDTIDTDANGNLFCGSDSGGSATLGSLFENRDWQVSTIGGGLYLQPTSTITVFANNGFISSASSTVMGDLTVDGAGDLYISNDIIFPATNASIGNSLNDSIEFLGDQTLTLDFSSLTTSRTLTFPNFDSTFAVLGGAQTFTGIK